MTKEELEKDMKYYESVLKSLPEWMVEASRKYMEAAGCSDGVVV